MTQRVLLLQRRLPEYRVAFFERLRGILATRQTELTLVYGPPDAEAMKRSDRGVLDWATPVATHYVPVLGGRVTLQRIRRRLWSSADLVICPHEAGYLPSYRFLFASKPEGPRVALWGHGVDPAVGSGIPHNVKSFTSRLPDWWFAYTELSAVRIVATGFPRERITCVENALDTADTVGGCDSTVDDQRVAKRDELGIAGTNVAVFLGSLTEDKRLDVLISACDIVRERVPDFHLVVIGDGSLMPEMRAAAATRAWLHVVGALHGREKVAACLLARVMLNPGMVGLNIVDAFALGTPMVTTEHDDHSPEIAYLVPGENGLKTQCTPRDFAAAVVEVLTDEALRQRLRSGCARAASRYTVGRMATRFADGISAALAASRRSAARPRLASWRGGMQLARSLATGGPGLLTNEAEPDSIDPVADAASVGSRDVASPHAAAGRVSQGVTSDLRVLIFHPALAPYRVDFFNALSSRCTMRVVFLHENALEQDFDQGRLRRALNVDVGYLTRGVTVLKRPFRIGLMREIRNFKPDVVVTNEFSPATLAVAAQRARFSRRTAHVVWTDDNPASVARDVWARRAARALALRRIDGLVVLSDEAAAMYRTRFHAKVPIGVSPLLQQESVFRDHLRQAAPLAAERIATHGLSGRRVLLTVGRLAPEKRVDRLLTAFARVHESMPDTVLVVVGDGSQREPLAALARSLGVERDALFVGRHEGDSLYAWYLIGSVFALPSEHEPFGAVVNEALLAGMPVVCSDRAGARTLIQPSENGVVVDASDVTAFARALAEKLNAVSPVGTGEAARCSLMPRPFSDAVEGFVGVLEMTCKRRRPPAAAPTS